MRTRSLSETERAAYEAHIVSLNDQIQWLRASVETLTGLGPRAAAAETGPAPAMNQWVSEEEEEIQEMLANGQIDHAEATAALEAVGALSTDIEYP